ncbi:MAG: dTDP-4-dehydrorhamnose 3,5-epimerase [Bacteroidales bacterium]|nr:dTDP-4-dehydrorhamnose 3,5-epimerase [Bacteroidales bacterium]
MTIHNRIIDGLQILETTAFWDSRGCFFESYHQLKYKEQGIACDFVQDNVSLSSYGVIRGLHFQSGEFAQAKLVQVLKGKVLDVAVDLRPGSPTFGQHYSVELSDENHLQFFIPRGFAHGFSVLSEEAVFHYKCDNYYHKESESGIVFNDPTLNIDWMIPKGKEIVSEKDLELTGLESLKATMNI